MKFKVDKLIIETTSNRDVVVPFSPNITYFHGESTSGKSSIVRLIDYCFGGSFELTTVLKKEFQSARVECRIGDHEVVLKRRLHHNELLVRYRKNLTETWQTKIVPIDEKDKPIFPGTSIANLSDFIFYLSGKEPIMVRKSRTREDSQLVRLSIRDLLEYCYLEQVRMVSSLFELNSENYSVRLKSQDTLDLILGFHRDEISRLQIQLDEVYSKIRSKEESANNFQIMLESSQIQDIESISTSIDKLKADKHKCLVDIESIQSGINPVKNHTLDELRNQALTLSLEISEVSASIQEYKARISYEQKLRNDFATASVHMKRSNTIRTILKDAKFSACPQCGVKLGSERQVPNHCPLCLQSEDAESTVDSNVVNEDLIDRISELDESVENLKRKQEKLEMHLVQIKETKERIDIQINQLNREYDSQYLSKIRDLDRKVYEIDAEIHLQEKYLQFAQKLVTLRKEKDELVIEQDAKKQELKKAKERAGIDASKLFEVGRYLLDILINSKAPEFHPTDKISINEYDFIPRIAHSDSSESHFFNLGSAGLKALFKCSFAVALQRFATHDPNNYLPSILILDSPMQHISEKVDKPLFENFYDYLYKLAATELKDVQIIIVDKEYREPAPQFKHLVLPRFITRSDKAHPPLIPWILGQDSS